MVEQRSSTPYMWVQFLLPLFIFKTNNIFVKKIFTKPLSLPYHYHNNSPLTSIKFNNKKYLNSYSIPILFLTKKYTEKLNSTLINPSYAITQYQNRNSLKLFNHYFSKKKNKCCNFRNNLNFLKRYTSSHIISPTKNNNFRLNKAVIWGTKFINKKSSTILYKMYYFNKIRNCTRVCKKIKTIIYFFKKRNNTLLMTDLVAAGVLPNNKVGGKYTTYSKIYTKFFTNFSTKHTWFLSKTALFYLYNTKLNTNLRYNNGNFSSSGGGSSCYYNHNLTLTLAINIKNTLINITTKHTHNYPISSINTTYSIKNPYFTIPLIIGGGINNNKGLYNKNLIYKYFVYFMFYYNQYNLLLKTHPIEFLTKKNYFNKYLSIFLGNSVVSTTSSRYNFIKIFKKENNLQIFFLVFTKLMGFKKLLLYNNVGCKKLKTSSNNKKKNPSLVGLLKQHLHIYNVVKYILKYKNIYKYLYLLKKTNKHSNMVGKGKTINTFRFYHIIITFLNIKKFSFKNNYKNKFIPIKEKNNYNQNLIGNKDLSTIRYMRIFKKKN